jgi:hypothetical protein
VRLRIVTCVVLAGVGLAHAQQTVTPPPPPPGLPSNFPQYQTYAGCVMNCDTKTSMCQSTCSINNSPSATFPSTTSTLTGARPDPGALAQCYVTCNAQQLSCKQACVPPH